MTATAFGLKTCPTCGDEFRPQRDHYWQCQPCWHKHAANVTAIARKGRVDDLLQEREILKQRLAEREAEIQRLQCALLEARFCPQGSPKLPADITEQIPRLLQLCHPDKHGNSASSTQATAWLLKMRREACS